jgi:hypothetical protein
MNLPEKNQTGRDRVVRQATWVAMGLFAPEYLTFAALAELEQAKKVQLKVSSCHHK